MAVKTVAGARALRVTVPRGSIGTRFAITLFVGTEPGVPNRIPFILYLASGALTGMLLAGCGLSLTPQPAPAISRRSPVLRPAPGWVADRMTRAEPDLYLDLVTAVRRGGQP